MHSARTCMWLLAASLAVPSTLLAQTVHVVPHQGDLQSFVDLAQPGDVLTFEAPFLFTGPVDIDKGLTFLDCLFYTGPEGFLVHDVPSGQEVVFRNCALTYVHDSFGAGGYGFRVQDCAGGVVFEDCSLSNWLPSKRDVGLLEIYDSDTVLLSSSKIEAFEFLESGFSSFVPEPAVRCERSGLWIQASELIGAQGLGEVVTGSSQAPFVSSVGGSPGLIAVDSRVVASDSRFEGGRGGPTITIATPGPGGLVLTCVGPLPGNPGVQASGTTELVWLDSTQVAGDFGDELCTPSSPYPAPGAALELEDAATYQFDSLGSTIDLEPENLSPGDSTVLSLFGEPGEIVLAAFSSQLAPAPMDMPGGFGLWLGDPVPVVVSLGTLDAQGGTAKVFSAPSTPSAGAVHGWIQGLGLVSDGAGGFELRTYAPAGFTLL